MRGQELQAGMVQNCAASEAGCRWRRLRYSPPVMRGRDPRIHQKELHSGILRTGLGSFCQTSRQS